MYDCQIMQQLSMCPEKNTDNWVSIEFIGYFMWSDLLIPKIVHDLNN